MMPYGMHWMNLQKEPYKTRRGLKFNATSFESAESALHVACVGDVNYDL